MRHERRRGPPSVPSSSPPAGTAQRCPAPARRCVQQGGAVAAVRASELLGRQAVQAPPPRPEDYAEAEKAAA